MSGTENARPIRLHEDWRRLLADEFAAPYMADLRAFLLEERERGAIVHPPGDEIFAALDLTPPGEVKALILGQDPYHGPGQAHGLSFSVKPGVRPPPSLINIYKELEADLGISPARHGNLVHWARQGVLLLNTVLTVRTGEAASHKGKGWERFTDAVIRAVSASDAPTVFLLWGAHAAKKAKLVDTTKHLVIKSAHPSPLSAHSGFFGSRPFRRINRFLEDEGRAPIDWRLPAEA